MKLKTFEEYGYNFGDNRDYSKEINTIIDELYDNKIEFEEKHRDENMLTLIINHCPFTLTFLDGEVSILTKVEQFPADMLGTYYVDSELDIVIDTICNFDVEDYKQIYKKL
jgi:hypothetical protein